MRFTIDPWDPSYDSPFDEGDLGETSADVRVDLELPAAGWRPLGRPVEGPARTGRLPEPVVVVDGVRRIDARIWLEPAPDRPPVPGLCASWAAGAVRCDDRAEVVAVRVGRAVFTPEPDAGPVRTAHGVYDPHLTPAGDPDRLSLALQERMALDEIRVADAAGPPGARPALLVVDGPLRSHQHRSDAIGLIKSQRVRYLPDSLDQILGSLRPGQRTPAFTIATTWTRHAWYLRLPGGDRAAARSGIVRCECGADLTPAEVVALADRAAALLPFLASERHKDPRAPQNLVPIAGLERLLRHRLGDRGLLERALRAAAGSS